MNKGFQKLLDDIKKKYGDVVYDISYEKSFYEIFLKEGYNWEATGARSLIEYSLKDLQYSVRQGIINQEEIDRRSEEFSKRIFVPKQY